jgi:hypothetical protein
MKKIKRLLGLEPLVKWSPKKSPWQIAKGGCPPPPTSQEEN